MVIQYACSSSHLKTTWPFIIQDWDAKSTKRAGAHWRSHAGPDELEQQRWDTKTYREWMETVRKGDGERAGLGVSQMTILV